VLFHMSGLHSFLWLILDCAGTPYFLYSFFGWWRLGCFQFWAFMNNAAVYTFGCRFFHEHMFSVLLSVYLRVELMAHMVTLCLTFWGTSRPGVQFYTCGCLLLWLWEGLFMASSCPIPHYPTWSLAVSCKTLPNVLAFSSNFPPFKDK
jgi:hypothetical protein